VSPVLYRGIFMLKSNVDTSIELDTIMCTTNKKVRTLGWVNMGNDLWSPCCSYVCFFEFLCVPANCLSVYDIVFPMFWTFLRVQPRKVTIEKKDKINEYKKKEKTKRRAYQCPPSFIVEYLC
jgi:hypothetical protein